MNMSVLLDVLKGRVMGSGRLLNVDHTISDYLTRGIGTVAARPLCMRKVRGSIPRFSSGIRMVTCSIHVGRYDALIAQR